MAADAETAQSAADNEDNGMSSVLQDQRNWHSVEDDETDPVRRVRRRMDMSGHAATQQLILMRRLHEGKHARTMDDAMRHSPCLYVVNQSLVLLPEDNILYKSVKHLTLRRCSLEILPQQFWNKLPCLKARASILCLLIPHHQNHSPYCRSSSLSLSSPQHFNPGRK